jgi:hypothetical protein
MSGLARALVVAGLVHAAALAEGAELRFSGHVTLLDPGGTTILVEELGPEKGGRPIVIQRSVNVGPDTTFHVVERVRQDDGVVGAYKESPATARDVKGGDFVTVTAQTRDGKLHAATVSIVRPDASR